MFRNNGEGKGTLNVLWGIGLGAAAMYTFDPVRGRQRRALLRRKAVHAWHELEGAAQVSSEDFQNRVIGAMAKARSAIQREPITDEVLVERVRAKLGRVATQPSWIDVKSEQGSVTLTGDVLEHELSEVVAVVRSVRGVKSVENLLRAQKQKTPGKDILKEAHEHAPHQTRWTPTTRLAMASTGTVLALHGARRGGLLGSIAGGIGLSLVVRSITNREMKELVGLGQNGFAIEKTINIDAPVSELFDFWANPENYPRVLQHVREVKKVGENRYHWTVTSPAGAALEWEGTITKAIPNELIAWKSLPGSLIGNWGVARFDPNYDGSTRLLVRMSYQPPVGAVGHVVAELLGADPKTTLDKDLIRLKSFFEHGKTRVHGHIVTREEVKQNLAV